MVWPRTVGSRQLRNSHLNSISRRQSSSLKMSFSVRLVPFRLKQLVCNLESSKTVACGVHPARYFGCVAKKGRSAVGPAWRPAGPEVSNSKHFSMTPAKFVNPLIWYLARPVAKFTAMVFGRGVRKWWQNLPKDKKTLFVNSLKRHKYKIASFSVLTGGLTFFYYETHVQEAPITNRRRLIAFTPSQIQELADFQFEMLLEDFEGSVVQDSNNLHRRVQSVVQKLVNANTDIPSISEKAWAVTVVEDRLQNAFVLPNGKIFVFKGMLDLCLNDDQLGIIVGHEMAHAILDHGAEQMSYLQLIDVIAVVAVGVIWTILPTDLVSALVHWLLNRVITLTMELPFSRQLETEADEIGLKLSAKACFDVRESSAFWKRLDVMDRSKGEVAVEWLSTHPTNDSRHKLLEIVLPEAIILRQLCKCPPLPAVDPRKSVVVPAAEIENPSIAGIVSVAQKVINVANAARKDVAAVSR